ncbi:hypothetical protein HYW32_01720 [Candidatus Berkelbacteria bacterium]|nr:hypothetical protein [Candidatus Berkelbacteria bacterium]
MIDKNEPSPLEDQSAEVAKKWPLLEKYRESWEIPTKEERDEYYNQREEYQRAREQEYNLQAYHRWDGLRRAMTDFRQLVAKQTNLDSAIIGPAPPLDLRETRAWAERWDELRLDVLVEDEVKPWLRQHARLPRNLDWPRAIIVFQFPVQGELANIKPLSRGDRLERKERKNFPDLYLPNPMSSESEIQPQTKQSNNLSLKKMKSVHKIIDRIMGRDTRQPPNAEFQAMVERIQSELKPYGGFGHRLTPPGLHDPEAYYYVWGWWANGEPYHPRTLKTFYSRPLGWRTLETLKQGFYDKFMERFPDHEQGSNHY